jgi:hypothetical protein
MTVNSTPGGDEQTWRMAVLDPWGWWVTDGKEGFHVGGSNPEYEAPARQVVAILNALESRALVAEAALVTMRERNAKAANRRIAAWHRRSDEQLARIDVLEAALRDAEEALREITEYGHRETRAIARAALNRPTAAREEETKPHGLSLDDQQRIIGGPDSRKPVHQSQPPTGEPTEG